MPESPASVTDDAHSKAGHIARLVPLVLFTKVRRFPHPLLSLLPALLLAFTGPLNGHTRGRFAAMRFFYGSIIYRH